jgi:hypothetical protein
MKLKCFNSLPGLTLALAMHSARAVTQGQSGQVMFPGPSASSQAPSSRTTWTESKGMTNRYWRELTAFRKCPISPSYITSTLDIPGCHLLRSPLKTVEDIEHTSCCLPNSCRTVIPPPQTRSVLLLRTPRHPTSSPKDQSVAFFPETKMHPK